MVACNIAIYGLFSKVPEDGSSGRSEIVSAARSEISSVCSLFPMELPPKVSFLMSKA